MGANQIFTPWETVPWGDGTANVENADGDTICRDISIVEANLIVRAVNAYEANEALIKELVEALKDAVEGWEDGAHYKGDYLREKHGDAEGIALAKALIAKLEARV